MLHIYLCVEAERTVEWIVPVARRYIQLYRYINSFVVAEIASKVEISKLQDSAEV